MLTHTDVATSIPSACPTHDFSSAAANHSSQINFEHLRAEPTTLRRRLEPGQSLYRAGQPFQSLFVIHAGSMKTCVLTEDGREQVTGFRMRGDLLGVESIGMGEYACDAIALESGETWELPYPACLRIAELQTRLTQTLAQEIRRDHSWMLALGTLAAEQRIAAFLLDQGARYQALGFSGKRFFLRMSRADMASYLVLKHETVSRALSHLAVIGCLVVHRRDIEILDSDCLQRMVSASGSGVDETHSIERRSIASRTAAASCSRRYGLRSTGVDLLTTAPA